MLRRKAELVADQRRIQAGAPAPVLPGKAEWPRVREWTTKQGLPGISAGVSKPSHTVLELYRAAHSKDPAAPSAPLLPSSEALDFAVWVAKEVFNEAVKDARILGVAVNPPAALKTGWYGRDTGIVRRKTNKRKPAEPDEIRRIAARLHPAHRLPLWLGVGSGC